MKNYSKLLVLFVALLGLSACGSMGNVDMEPPYSIDRTASHDGNVKVAEVETVAVKEVTHQCQACPAPVQCEDVSAWKSRAMQAERDLAQCMEASKRVKSTYRDSLRK